MAIKINGTTTIDDSKNFFLEDITFGDATVQSSAQPPNPNITKVSAGGALTKTINSYSYLTDSEYLYGTSTSEQFGYSVAADGNYAIVGAYWEDDAGGGDSGKAYIFNVTTGTLLWTLNNPNAYSTSTSDYFGWSVAISGNYAIVSAYFEDDASGATSGKAYIFNVTTGALLWTLDNPNAYSTSAGDQFGWSVAISGNYAIVSAAYEDDAGGTSSGKAYIYNVATGALLQTLDNPTAYGASVGDNFGQSVAISGNYAIVGALGEDDAGGIYSSKAYIFNVTTGALLSTLDNPNAYGTSAFDYFGRYVAMSGNYAIVGASGEADTGGAGSGKAYIYNVTTGALVHTLNNPNAYSTRAGDNFGTSVAISGNYAIVGAAYEDDASGTSSGKAYIFNVTTGALLSTLDNPNAYSTSAVDYFSWSVAISGNYAIVGAKDEDDAGGINSGKAYIFNTVNTAWTDTTLSSTLDNPNAYKLLQKRINSVAISGNYIIIGVYGPNDLSAGNSGKAYIFNVTTGTLLQTLDNPNDYGTSLNDYFGISVAISGNYAIVGAYFEDDAGGLESGKAYIFNVTTGALLWTLNNPNAYSTSLNDYFGQSVAISGNYAIVGALNEDDAGGTFSGKAYIYNVTTGALLWTLDNPNAYSTSAGDVFGDSVAISGNYAIVGVYFEDDAGGNSSGKAYIYNVTTGTLLWALDNPNLFSTSFSDRFGTSVAISGNYAIVGAYYEDDAGGLYSLAEANAANPWVANGIYSGSEALIIEQTAVVSDASAYSYVTTGPTTATVTEITYVAPNNTGLTEIVAELPLNNLSYDDNFFDVSPPWNTTFLDTSYAAIYYGANGYLTFGSGSNVYQNLQLIPIPRIHILAGDDANLGLWVGTTGTAPNRVHHIVVKSEFDAYNNYTSAGSVLVFYEIRLHENETNRVDVHHDILSVTLTSADSGKAYIFNVTTGALVHTLDNPNAYSTSTSDQFGKAVAISGNYAIVGANLESNNLANGDTVYAFTISDTYSLLNVSSMNNIDSIVGPGLPIVKNSPNTFVATLNNPNAYSTSASDQFGYSIAIDGNYAIVGASYEADAGGINSGKAYIFNATTGALLRTLDNPTAYGTSLGDFFGSDVAISGNYAIVGAYQEGYSGGLNSGKAYIFYVTTGALVHTLNNPNAYSVPAGDFFGYSVAISGNYAIVSAVQEDDPGGTFSGKAYIYNVTTGALLWTLNNPNAYSTSGTDYFGWSAAISGNYAIVSAHFEYDTGGSASGKAYIYNVTTGALLWTLDNPNPYSTSSNDQFGYSVAISGNYAIVGAYFEDDIQLSSGKAYIFNVTTGALVHTLDNPTAYSITAADNFGESVAISGNYAIVGAHNEDDVGGAPSGKAYIFNVTTGALVYTLDNPNAYSTSLSDRFGWSVAIDGNYAIVGANQEDDAGGLASGKAYIFDISEYKYLETASIEDKLITLLPVFERKTVSLSY